MVMAKRRRTDEEIALAFVDIYDGSLVALELPPLSDNQREALRGAVVALAAIRREKRLLEQALQRNANGHLDD